MHTLAGFQGAQELLAVCCSIGTIAPYLASSVRRLTGMEVVPAAVHGAAANARLNDIANAELHAGPAGRLLPGLGRRGYHYRPDVVVTWSSPTRPGAGAEADPVALSAVTGLRPSRLICVSCAPSPWPGTCAAWPALATPSEPSSP